MSSITTSSHKTFLFQWKCIFFLQKLFHQIVALHPNEKEDLTIPFLTPLPTQKDRGTICSPLVLQKSACSLSLFRRLHLLCLKFCCWWWWVFFLTTRFCIFQTEKKQLKEWNLSTTRARNVLLVNKGLFQCPCSGKKNLFWRMQSKTAVNYWNPWELCTNLSFTYS